MTGRVEVIGPALLIQGDCHELLASVGPVDAIVTDPPYGIGYVHSGGGRGKHSRRNHSKTIAGDARPFDPRPFLTAAPQVIMWGADHFYPRLPDSGRFLGWDKLAGANLRDSFADIEFAWQNREAPARVFSYLWKGLLQEGEKGERRIHPTQKPVDLMAWSISQLVGEPAVICDPFMGSGSTAIAALKAGRRFVGFEIDPDHFDAACLRIARAWNQRDMLGRDR